MRLVLFICLLIPIIANANIRDSNTILPLSIMAGGGWVTANRAGDTAFDYSRLFEVSGLYHARENIGVGPGINVITRDFDYQGNSDTYSIESVFLQTLWHPVYSRDGGGMYIGARVNLHAIVLGKDNTVGFSDRFTSGFEPTAGMLVPFIYPHLFIDIALSYQFRKFPVMYHQPAAERQYDVDDSSAVLQIRLRF